MIRLTSVAAFSVKITAIAGSPDFYALLVKPRRDWPRAVSVSVPSIIVIGHVAENGQRFSRRSGRFGCGRPTRELPKLADRANDTIGREGYVSRRVEAAEAE